MKSLQAKKFPSFNDWNKQKHLFVLIHLYLAKNIGLLYRVNQFLNEDSLKTVYLSYILSYLNYANTAWESVCNEIEKFI